MRQTILFLLLFATLHSFAQSDTTVIFFAKNGSKVKNLEKAVSIARSYQADSNRWITLLSDKSGKKMELRSFGDQNLKILNGVYISYKNGLRELRGNFASGSKSGPWVKYDSLGNVVEIKNYNMDLPYGLYRSYWPNQAIKEEGNYHYYKRIGEWKLLYDNGKLAASEVYDENEKLTDSTYFDRNGLPVTKDKIKTSAKFPGGISKLYQYIGENLKFPAEYIGKSIVVSCSFTITETGNVVDVKVLPDAFPALTNEVNRVLKSCPKWMPATTLEMPVAIYFSLPLSLNSQDSALPHAKN